MAETINPFANRISHGRYNGDFSRYTNQKTVFWLWREEEPSRHFYVYAASLPGINAAPEAVVDFLKCHFEMLFPLGARERSGNAVEPGAIFTIATRTPLPSQVVCIDATPYQFTLQTVPNRHALKGEITFGVFEDAVGVLWLFQQGQGHPGENTFQLLLTRIMPRFLWRRMRSNLLTLWQKKRGA